MPIALCRYWNNGFGRTEGQINQDEEGLQNARVVARNMVFLMKAIRDAKEKYGLPETEKVKSTHFIKQNSFHFCAFLHIFVIFFAHLPIFRTLSPFYSVK